MGFFFHGSGKGAITIFLVIITVPCLLFCAVMIDGARMESAKAITQEAADLAALSTLADYNVSLKDRYGLFAMADYTKIEDIYKESLAATLLAGGLSENQTYSDKIWEIMKDAIAGSNTYAAADFLNLYDFRLEEGTAVTPLYSLANYQVLENQMVEHAKYRGVYLMAERLEILSWLDDAKEEERKNQETSDVMMDKMDIDDLNAAADRAFGVLCGAVESLNQSVAGVKDSTTAYGSSLATEMQGIADSNLAGHAYGSASSGFTSAQNTLQNHAQASVENAQLVLETAEIAKKEMDKAKERLNQFIAENQSKAEGNEAIQSMIKEAQDTIADYDQCYQSMINSLQNDSTLKKLSQDTSLKANIGKEMARTDTAIRKYEEELEEVRKAAAEEESEEPAILYYYFYDLDLKDANEDGLEMRKTEYLPAINEYTDYFRDLQWNGQNAMVTRMEEKSEDEEPKVDKDFAKEQSERTDEAEEEDETAGRKEVPQEVYNIRPSKNFQPTSADMSAGAYSETDLSGAKSVLSSGKQQSFLLQLGETVRDDALCLSYMFGTFKTRLTGRFDGSTPASDYLPEWRTAHESGEINMRFMPKAEEDTVLRSEIEYLIFGQRTDKGNENAVYAAIYGTRLVNNIIALKQNTGVSGACHTAAAAACAATLGTVPEPVFYWIFLSAWAVAETYMDMYFLMNKGYRIPLFKSKDQVLLALSPGGTGDELVTNYGSPDGKFFVCYEDYLLLLLLLSGRETRIMRSADLVEMNMKTSQSSFAMAEAYTYLKAETKMSLRYLFGSTAPFQASYEQGGISGRMRFQSTIYQGY